MASGSKLTLCSMLFSGFTFASGDLPTIGSTPVQPVVAKGDAETCHRLQQDFDIDLKKVVAAGCDPSTEQIAKLMDNPVGNLVLLFNQVDYTALKAPEQQWHAHVGQVQLHADLSGFHR